MTAPTHLRSGDGRTYQLGRITLTVKLSVAETGGAYTLCEAIEPPGAAASLHRHPTYDETHSARAATSASSAATSSRSAPAPSCTRRAARPTAS